MWVDIAVEKEIRLADTIILDIDGVLVDVSKSYRRVAVEAVKRYFREVLSEKMPEALKVEDTQIVKNAGMFNNDWDLTYALALYQLMKSYGFEGGLEDFANEIKDLGGGIENAEKTARKSVEWDKICERWDKEKLWELFQEYYLGEELFTKIYKRKPAFVRGEGFIKKEKVLVDKKTVGWMRNSKLKFGIVTGRPLREAKMALEMCGLDFLKAGKVISEDDFAKGTLKRKPFPDAIFEMRKRLKGKKAIYVGDTRDDIETVEKARELSGRFFSVAVLSGAMGRNVLDEFKEMGANAIMLDVNSLPKVMEGGK